MGFARRVLRRRREALATWVVTFLDSSFPRLILSTHPNARSPQVPRYLYSGHAAWTSPLPRIDSTNASTEVAILRLSGVCQPSVELFNRYGRPLIRQTAGHLFDRRAGKRRYGLQAQSLTFVHERKSLAGLPALRFAQLSRNDYSDILVLASQRSRQGRRDSKVSILLGFWCVELSCRKASSSYAC